MNTITFNDFAKLDLRVATIKSAERVKGSDKLVRLSVSTGGAERTLVAGIAGHYSVEELVGKKIVVVANLESKKLRGIESNGMLLAACSEDGARLALLTTDKEIEDGCKVS